MICPKCGSPNVECDTVDVGVGQIQSGPYGCIDCHWVQPDATVGFDLSTADAVVFEGRVLVYPKPLKPKYEIDMQRVRLAVAEELYKRKYERILPV